MRLPIRVSKLLMIALMAAVLAVLVPGENGAQAHEYCAKCQNVCLGDAINGGCSVYYGRAGYYTATQCPSGSTDRGRCMMTAVNTCYTTYTVCSTGSCSGTSCVNGAGCASYTYTTMDASPTFTGPANCQ